MWMEIWDLVDERRKALGKLQTRGKELLFGEYHIAVEIFTINVDGRLLLTQRDPMKTFPLMWECTGGSITTGESSLDGALRELHEETGLLADPDDFYYAGELKRSNCFLDNYIWRSPEHIKIKELKLQAGEVYDAKLVTLEELDQMNKQGLIVSLVWERLELYRKVLIEWSGREKWRR